MKAHWNGFSSPLAPHIEQYLATKRAMGCTFATEDRQLRLLDRFLEEQGVKRIEAIDSECLQAFMASRHRLNARSYNNLLGVVRRLFDWIVSQESLAVSPVKADPQRETGRRLPFLFSPLAIRQLLACARALEDNARAELRGPTYEMIFALLAGLGLRVGEVVRLRWGDVDLEREVLEIRNTKFGKDRMVPFGPKMAARLQDYRAMREALDQTCSGNWFLFSWNGRDPVSTNTIRNTFREKLLPQLALDVPLGVFGPHVHSLRHSFAVRTLLCWYRQGTAPADRLHHLSTFLGHANPAATAVYLTITSDLLNAASTRFEAFAPVFVGEVAP